MTTEGKNAAAEEAITKEALTRYQATTGPRLREIILSLIKHLHGFARDVRLTGDEYLFAMNYLVQLGGYCKGGRQEFLALAEMLGLETLVIQISQPKPESATLPGVLGPFFLPNEPLFGERRRHRRRRRGRASLRLGVYSRDRSSACSKRDHQRSGNRTGGDCTTCKVTWPRTECGRGGN